MRSPAREAPRRLLLLLRRLADRPLAGRGRLLLRALLGRLLLHSHNWTPRVVVLRGGAERRHENSTTLRRLINVYRARRIPTGRWTSPRSLRRRRRWFCNRRERFTVR